MESFFPCCDVLDFAVIPPLLTEPRGWAINHYPLHLRTQNSPLQPPTMAVTQKVSVTVRFSKSGLQPPVFLAGSFSDWQPQEMHHILSEHNEHEYYRQVEVESGKEYQYKFRIGEGDWWVLDEGSQIGMFATMTLSYLFIFPFTCADRLIWKQTLI